MAVGLMYAFTDFAWGCSPMDSMRCSIATA